MIRTLLIPAALLTACTNQADTMTEGAELDGSVLDFALGDEVVGENTPTEVESMSADGATYARTVTGRYSTVIEQVFTNDSPRELVAGMELYTMVRDDNGVPVLQGKARMMVAGRELRAVSHKEVPVPGATGECYEVRDFDAQGHFIDHERFVMNIFEHRITVGDGCIDGAGNDLSRDAVVHYDAFFSYEPVVIITNPDGIRI
jgi:hypothetical protein